VSDLPILSLSLAHMEPYHHIPYKVFSHRYKESVIRTLNLRNTKQFPK